MIGSRRLLARPQRARYGSRVKGGLRRALLVLSTLALAWLAFAYWGPSSAVVEGQAIPLDRARVHEWASEHAERWAAERVTVHAGNDVRTWTRAELGASLDVSALVEDLDEARVARMHPARAYEVFARQPHRARWRRATDREALYRIVDELRAEVTVPPVPKVLGPSGEPMGGAPGHTIDREQSVAALADAIERNAVHVVLELVPIPAPEPLLQADSAARYDSQVALRQSRYSSDSGRGHNIERAARELDGAVVPPGAALSFNELVGARTLDRGFVLGPEVGPGHTLVEGIGGGICQVATELYRASLDAGLAVDQYHPHSRRVGYAPPGLDAAVAWPSTDLVVRNVLPYHLRLRASAVRGRLQVGWEGARPGPVVETRSRVVRGSPDDLSRPMFVQVTRSIAQGEQTHEETWEVEYPAIELAALEETP